MAAIAAPAVGALRDRISRVWPRSLDDATVLVVGFAGALSHLKEVVELVCSRQLSTALSTLKDPISLNEQETLALLAAVAAKAVAADVCRNEAFVERAHSLAGALQCTLLEPSAMATFKRPAVQLALLVGMQGAEPPFGLLDSIFGSIVRADVRRVEDLHDEFTTTKAPNTVLITEMLFAVASSALG